jgi:hypothetical protein
MLADCDYTQAIEVNMSAKMYAALFQWYSRNSSATTVPRLRVEPPRNQGSVAGTPDFFLSSPQQEDWFNAQPKPPYPVGNGIRSRGMKRRAVKCTTRLHPKSRMSGYMLLIPHSSSTRVAYISTRTVSPLRTQVESVYVFAVVVCVIAAVKQVAFPCKLSKRSALQNNQVTCYLRNKLSPLSASNSVFRNRINLNSVLFSSRQYLLFRQLWNVYFQLYFISTVYLNVSFTSSDESSLGSAHENVTRNWELSRVFHSWFCCIYFN